MLRSRIDGKTVIIRAYKFTLGTIHRYGKTKDFLPTALDVPEIAVCSFAWMINHKKKLGGNGPILAHDFGLIGVCFYYLPLWIHKIDTTVKYIYALCMVNEILSADFEGRFSLSIDLQDNRNDYMVGYVEECIKGQL